MNNQESLLLQPKTRKALAALYGIDRKTLIRRIREAGIVLPSGVIMPATLRLIYDKLGPPPLPGR